MTGRTEMDGAAVVASGTVWKTYAFLWSDGRVVAVTKGRDGILDPRQSQVSREGFWRSADEGLWQSRVCDLTTVPRDVLLAASGAVCPRTFWHAFVNALLFTETDESDPETGGDPLDVNYDMCDLDDTSLAVLCVQCSEFWKMAGESVRESYHNGAAALPALAGHDFVMSRNGHGCGFWDGDWTPEETADFLDQCARAFGEIEAYVGDDRAIHVSSIHPDLCKGGW